MDDAESMQMLERRRDLQQIAPRPYDRTRPGFAVDDLPERSAVDELEHQHKLAAESKPVDQADDVLVARAALDRRLAAQAPLVISRHLVELDQLERDGRAVRCERTVD